jgi:predicted metal-dependent peptidase
MNNVETLGKASKELMLKEPFYGLLLISLNKLWSDRRVPTAGVTLNKINYELIINPNFWEPLPPEQKMGILKHELLHIAFFHLTDYTTYKDKEILNIAMDIEINQYIDRNWLPKEGCFLENFPELNMEKKKGSRYYYDKLLQEQQCNQAFAQALADAIDGGLDTCELPNGESIQLPKHDWEMMEKLPESTRKLIETQTKHIVTQVADQVEKSRGTIPGEFAELLEKLRHIEPPKFDWKGYIRRFTGKSVKTYTKKSRRKYNKRLPENPGLKIKRQKHLLVGIDTSGSVSTSELKEFLNELWHMKKTGSDVTIIQCDTSISHVGRFEPKKDLEIHGRGGTCFQPVIDYYNEHQKDFSCLMYFTDGEAPAPENVRGNILWVISSNGTVDCLADEGVGQVIQLEI